MCGSRWWGPHNFTNPVCELDVRVGGTWRIVMRGPDGTDYPCGGVYREIVPNERLVFTNIATDAAGQPVLEGLTTVTFAEMNGKTKMTVSTGATALVVDGERWTFAQLDDRVNRLADVLALQGIARGDRVGVLLGNTNEHVEVLLACFKLRALPVNLNTRLVAGELAELLTLSRADVVVHEPDLGDLLPPGVTGIERGPGYEAALAAAS